MTQDIPPTSPQGHHQRGPGYGNRGRGSRNRGRGRGNRGHNERDNLPSFPVPASREVIPGAGVSIVLKVDQPTGRQVQGIVSDVLTRGDHPRGVKVRLQDGRVGRVQRIVDKNVAQAASEGLSGLARNGEPTNVESFSRPSQHRTALNQGRRDFSDIREDPYDYDTYSSSRAPPSLGDYIRFQGNGNSSEPNSALAADPDHSSSGPDFASPTAVCPVCGLFEGDEAAVAFHANSHFD
jgi:uncharacterized repeat protein (TIGR03833 family)